MKRNILKGLLLSLIMVSSINTVVLADQTGTTTPTGTLNPGMNAHIDSINNTLDMVAWHFSGKYWGFGYPNKTIQEADLTYHLDDADAPYFFSGTSKLMPFTICQRYALPQSVKNFIYAYGTQQLGIRFSVAKSDMMYNGQFSYSINGNYLYVSFRPIINYTTNNVWRTYNPTVYNKMSYKVYVPYIKPGYGINALSAFAGNDSFAINPNIVASAYKGSDGNLHFNRDENVWMFSGGKYLNVRNVYSASSFWSGGNNGLHYYFPIKVDFYGMNIRHNGISLTNYEYHASNGRYWVKSGNNFNMNTSAVSIDQNGNNSIDDVVKVNSLHINVSNGTTNGYLDAKTHSSSNSIQSEKNASAGSLVNLVSGSGYRSGATLYNTFTTNITGDKDLHLHGLARLVNYPTAGSFSPEYVYKSLEWDGINVSSDSAAPTISATSTYGWTNSNVTVSASSTDSRSGMKNIILKDHNGIQVASGTSSLSYTVTGSGVLNYTVTATDNVGNVSNKSIVVNIDRVAPGGTFTPSSQSWTNGKITTTFNPSDTGGSGVNQWKYRISTNNGATWTNWSAAIYGDTSSAITLTTAGYNKIQCWIQDRANNQTYITSGAYCIYRYNITPTSIIIKDSSGNIVTGNLTEYQSYNAIMTYNNTGIDTLPSFVSQMLLGSTLKATMVVPTGLTAGSTGTVSFNFIPATTGTISITGKVDTSNQVYETNESDNTISINRTVQYVNLKVTAIQIVGADNDIEPTNLIQNQPYRAKITIANDGETPINAPFNVGLEENNTAFTGNTVTVSSLSNVVGSNTKIVYIPITPKTTGTRTFTGIVDYDNIIKESNETDNQMSTNKDVKYVNIKASSISIVDSDGITKTDFLLKGSTYKAIIQLVNDGQENMGAFNLGLYDNGINRGTLLIPSFAMNSAAPQTYTISFTPAETGTLRTFSAFADCDNIIPESNETDNETKTQIDVLDLMVSATLNPDPSKQGQKVTFDIWTIGNPNKIIIHYPSEIYSLDPSLVDGKKEISIQELPELNTKFEYYLPLKTPLTFDTNNVRIKLPYVFTIRAARSDGRYVETTVNLDVVGNILESLKTEIK